MLRKLDLIWTCLFLFGACTVHTYKPPLNLDMDLNIDQLSDNETDEEWKDELPPDQSGDLYKQLLDEKQKTMV